MTRSRVWGVTVFRNAKGAPMVSLGVHLDWHTPTLDLHLPLVTVQIGRNQCGRKRFAYYPPEPWSGHTDNCDCDRASTCDEPRCGCHKGTGMRWGDCTYPRQRAGEQRD